jgi:soluble lytic murein transglycosylase
MSKQMQVLLGFTLGSVLFFKSSSSRLAPALLQDQNAGERLAQAQEVLGATTAKKIVASTRERHDLKRFIASEVRRQLPPRYKSQSASITRTILDESQRRGLDPLLVMAVIQRESQFDPHAKGRHGEIGLIQIRPATARWIAGQKGIKWHSSENLFNSSYNLKVGLAYLSYLRHRYNDRSLLYLTAYNLGPANLQKEVQKKALRETTFLPHSYRDQVTKNYVTFYKSWTQSRESRLLALY